MSNDIKKPLIDEFNYYISHQEELVSKYKGKFLVIKGEKVTPFDTMEEAFDWGVKNIGIGKFLMQRCDSGEENYTQQFHSRAVFA
ncbi:MAG: hypothetical protein RBT65_14420 [Methanolobus sp.]|nr:hypothetical protein [Methanolobus sp.]